MNMQTAEILRLSTDEFRKFVSARLTDNQKTNQMMVEGDHTLNPEFYAKVVELALKPAAVLIPVVEREGELRVIFTKRTEKLKSHSGQISFPGGRIDAGDLNPKDAALRETWEEIGIRPDHVDVLGQMPDYYTGSGYHISTIVGLVNGDAELTRNPDEVEYVFEPPLSFLMDSENHKIGSRVFENVERYFYEMPWEDHNIWGVTAGIVRMFYNRVFK